MSAGRWTYTGPRSLRLVESVLPMMLLRFNVTIMSPGFEKEKYKSTLLERNSFVLSLALVRF